jgi:pSer/pThr/pTyr-binding forkhead associated (FHA) protein
MSATATPPNAALEGLTERFDPISCLDERVRKRAATNRENLEPGRYLEVAGPLNTVVIPLEDGVVRVGRSHSADLRLDDLSVSRRHAILEVGSEPRILDDRSSNGTFLNGARVDQATLRNGDEIAVGRVLLRYLEI